MALVCLPAVAAADAVQVDGAAPFTGDQLADAISLRSPHAPLARLRVLVDSENRVLVQIGESSCVVDVSGLTDLEAARRVALVCLELVELGPQQARDADATNAAVAVVAAAPQARDADATNAAVAVVAAAPPADARTPIRVGLLARSGRGLGLELSRPFSRRAAAHGHARWVRRSTAPGDVVDDVSLRAGLQARWVRDRFELAIAADLIVAPHWIRAADGNAERKHTELRAGAGASIRLRVKAGAGLALVALAALDAHATRQRYLVADDLRFDSGRFDPWVGARVEFELGGTR